ncbi:hypothetical protein ACQUQP_01895 [Marinobacterium sp. YM272]|uniref:hypothetical protein n=1 Tax=Marinobacterium sp. YM272 TaxID=3421654 RepID=UPI003D7FAEF5
MKLFRNSLWLKALTICLMPALMTGRSLAEGVARMEFYPVSSATMDDSAFLSNGEG